MLSSAESEHRGGATLMHPRVSDTLWCGAAKSGDDLVADVDAPIDEVWHLWADSRKLERWCGLRTYPSTFEKHDLSPGGEVT